jgi:hypothetical protein
MVSMKVGDQDSHVTPKPYRFRKEAALNSFPAVHQDDLAFALQGYRRESPARGRDGCARPQERDD